MRRADAGERAALGDLFARMCAVPSPFGREGAVADLVRRQLEQLGLTVEEDGAGAATAGECGNLLVRIPGSGPRTVLLCAHLDTVSVTGPIEPVVVDGGWENAHDAILGADNKAAVAVILAVAARAVAERPPVGLELLFTVSEENALAGVKAFDRSRLQADFGYVFDHATPIGEIVTASPTYFRLAAEFLGRSAHAGIRPEDGRSAVLAAARAVAAMPHGRLDAGTTANVGSMAGGVGSTNVVPERASLLAEVRSLDPDRAEAVVAEVIDAIHDGAAATGCDVDITSERLFTGFRIPRSEPAVQVAEAALRRCGYEPRPISTGGGSDANVLLDRGLRCVNLANGTERPHEPGERVSVAALDGMLDVALTLIDQAGTLPAPEAGEC